MSLVSWASWAAERATPRAEIELFGDGGAVVHQGLVFGGVAGVAGEGALAGELGDLLADELLFVEAVAETFEGGGGVGAEGR